MCEILLAMGIYRQKRKFSKIKIQKQVRNSILKYFFFFII